jgi:hypothetical protein
MMKHLYGETGETWHEIAEKLAEKQRYIRGSQETRRLRLNEDVARVLSYRHESCTPRPLWGSQDYPDPSDNPEAIADRIEQRDARS